jgi:hypothetical protein
MVVLASTSLQRTDLTDCPDSVPFMAVYGVILVAVSRGAVP